MENIQQLNRIAFEFGNFTVYWYGIIIGAGLLLGWILATNESKKQGLPKDI
ncbi:prolipoprotein diacylglyceryl transferase family protein, partial [Streptomyces albidoflavus]|uniref:prolipoprotein diacylglyceryl transferase family protein n=3 Tax=Bacillati TaxID=1783272 RepID=UPI003408A530